MKCYSRLSSTSHDVLDCVCSHVLLTNGNVVDILEFHQVGNAIYQLQQIFVLQVFQSHIRVQAK